MYKILLTTFLVAFYLGHARAQTDSTVSNTPGYYKKNIASLMLFQFTENGIGLGIGYERSLDRKSKFALSIPAIITFNIANTNRVYDYNTGNYKTGKADAILYAMPGIKFYPAGSGGKIKYATGASVVIGDGKQSNYLIDLNGLNTTEQIQSHFLAGLMWQNYLQINITSQVLVGAEAGIGSTFINQVGGKNQSNELLAQGSLKVGYRF